MRILVTGAAGFIGFHLTRRLLADGHQVTGFDGMTQYYDVRLKQERLRRLQQNGAFAFVQGMLEDKAAFDAAVDQAQPEVIVHLAAQAGVRYSVEHPETYVSSNLVGTFHVLEAARRCQPKHLLIASTSSIYGGNPEMPFQEAHRTDFPVSFYAATKKAGEAMSHSYAHLFGIPTTNFRFFTVYGPWGRPDMALFKFVSAIREGKPIEVYGQGQMKRDFTYIDDLVEGIVRLIDAVPVAGQPVTADGVVDSLSPVAPWRSVNIAGGAPTDLMEFIETVETAVGQTAQKIMLPMQEGDVAATFADAGLLKALTGFVPATPVRVGVGHFVDWYLDWSGRA